MEVVDALASRIRHPVQKEDIGKDSGERWGSGVVFWDEEEGSCRVEVEGEKEGNGGKTEWSGVWGREGRVKRYGSEGCFEAKDELLGGLKEEGV